MPESPYVGRAQPVLPLLRYASAVLGDTALARDVAATVEALEKLSEQVTMGLEQEVVRLRVEASRIYCADDAVREAPPEKVVEYHKAAAKVIQAARDVIDQYGGEQYGQFRPLDALAAALDTLDAVLS